MATDVRNTGGGQRSPADSIGMRGRGGWTVVRAMGNGQWPLDRREECPESGWWVVRDRFVCAEKHCAKHIPLTSYSVVFLTPGSRVHRGAERVCSLWSTEWQWTETAVVIG